MRDGEWLARLRDAVADGDRVGLAGLYGARRLRADGRYVGRTIVSSLEGAPPLPAPVTEVAAVDGVCLFLRRALLDQVGGFDEGYGFFHGYDRELSFAVREAGSAAWSCARPSSTGAAAPAPGWARPRRPAQDLAERRAALTRFAAKWRHRLPSDVRPLRDRLADRLRRP